MIITVVVWSGLTFSTALSLLWYHAKQTRPERALSLTWLRRPNRFLHLLLLLGICQNAVIYKVHKNARDDNKFSIVMDLPKEPDNSSLLSGKTMSSDVIVYLAQFSNVHSSYGAQSDALSQSITGLSKLQKSLDLLYKNYLDQFPSCNVIIFYDSSSPPDLRTQVELRRSRSQLEFRELNGTWWEVPYGLDEKRHHKWKRPKYSIGYRHMMRWFAVLIWPYLAAEGYTHVMRMDDDSYIHSKIGYNLFEYMRDHNKKYAFRQPVRDSAVGKGYDRVIDDYLFEHPNATTRDLIHSYKNVSRRVGFYNNWFIANIAFFTNEPASSLLRAIDESNLIYTQRTGDLVIHSTVVRLFLRPDDIQWFRDFTYEHMTLCRVDTCGSSTRTNFKGCPENGGVSRGFGVYSDEEWTAFATKIKEQFDPRCEVEIDWNFIGADDSVRDCEVKKHAACWDYLKTIPSATNGTVKA